MKFNSPSFEPVAIFASLKRFPLNSRVRSWFSSVLNLSPLSFSFEPIGSNVVPLGAPHVLRYSAKGAYKISVDGSPFELRPKGDLRWIPSETKPVLHLKLHGPFGSMQIVTIEVEISPTIGTRLIHPRKHHSISKIGLEDYYDLPTNRCANQLSKISSRHHGQLTFDLPRPSLISVETLVFSERPKVHVKSSHSVELTSFPAVAEVLHQNELDFSPLLTRLELSPFDRSRAYQNKHF